MLEDLLEDMLGDVVVDMLDMLGDKFGVSLCEGDVLCKVDM